MIKTTIKTATLLWMTSTVFAGPPSKIEEADKQITNQVYTRIDSMVVYQNNQLVAEHYYRQFKKDTLHRTHSSFKSITGLLALIAIDQKLLSSDEKILPLLALLESSKKTDPKQANITVGNLLDMTSGLDCDEAPGSNGPSHEWGVDEGPTPLKYSLDIDMKQEPGSEWHYCSANSFMLAATISAALKRAGGPDIFTFADQNLFAPLGITNYQLTRSQSGEYLNGQGNSYFTPVDLAQIGLLVLNKGNRGGKQIISQEALSRLYTTNNIINWSWTDTIPEHRETKSRYSNQWYQTDFDIEDSKVPVLHSWGNGGQFIFVVPSLDTVAVFTGSNQGSSCIVQQKQPFDIMFRYILPEMKNRINSHATISP